MSTDPIVLAEVQGASMLLRKLNFKKISFAVLIASFVCSNFCFAANRESIENLKNTVKNFVIKNVALEADESIDVTVSKVDGSLQLPACSSEIDAQFPSGSNREKITAVELSCNGVQPWHTYFPVNVQIFTKVLVARHVIPPKERISEDDLDYAQADKNHLYSGYFKDKNEVMGLEASQLITAGAVFTKKNIQQPVLVHRNEMIDLIAQKGAIVVTMKGISKSDGRLNEIIQAYNPSSKRTLDAIVTGTGKAEVTS